MSRKRKKFEWGWRRQQVLWRNFNIIKMHQYKYEKAFFFFSIFSIFFYIFLFIIIININNLCIYIYFQFLFFIFDLYPRPTYKVYKRNLYVTWLYPFPIYFSSAQRCIYGWGNVTVLLSVPQPRPPLPCDTIHGWVDEKEPFSLGNSCWMGTSLTTAVSSYELFQQVNNIEFSQDFISDFLQNK